MNPTERTVLEDTSHTLQEWLNYSKRAGEQGGMRPVRETNNLLHRLHKLLNEPTGT